MMTLKELRIIISMLIGDAGDDFRAIRWGLFDRKQNVTEL